MSINPNEPANFTPTLGSYRPLSPFRFWCQKVLPLVYDDSLSYYELLNKVVDYLNKAMEDVETLHGDTDALYQSFVQLQGYVNTYFSSLDVQEEINTKLDEMATDGSLTELISPFIPDLITDWLDEHITPTSPPVDNTLSVSGAAADAKKVGDELTNLNKSFANNTQNITSVFANTRETFLSDSSEWEQGAIVSGIEVASESRIRSKNGIYIFANTAIKFITSNYVIMTMYDLLGNYIETYPSTWSNSPASYTMPEDRIIRLSVRNAGSTAITPLEAKTVIQVFSNGFDKDTQTLYANGGEYSPFADASEWEQGAIVYGKLTNSETRIRTAKYWTIPKGATVTIVSGETDDATAYNFYAYSLYKPNNGDYLIDSGWQSGSTEFIADENVLLKIAVRKQNSANITPDELNLSVTVNACGTVSELSKVKVLAMGDSICYGARNDRKGFIGDVGCQYINTGSTGASISMAKTNNIPKQLIELTGYTPDVIVCNGGINDYGDGIAMGDVPVRVIDPNNDNPEGMNKNTVMGALNYLFYKMVTLYPNAQRFFLMPQHTWNWDRIEGAGGWNFDTFHENVTKVCNMYGVKIIDIYTQSPINTRYAEYRSTTSYSDTPPDTEKSWINYDGIHPLPFGYTNGYVPYVKEALRTATHKNN